VAESINLIGDRDLIFQTLCNLIDNAIKYTPEGGQIKIGLKESRLNATVVVADSGIGIPKEEREKVFQRFYRVAKSRSLPGNGLGLSLVQAVMGMHHGRVTLRDNAPGLIVELEFPKNLPLKLDPKGISKPGELTK
ncbi:MAG: two-component sensor histidine kinase, partial [Phototrophicales bacterium]